MQDCRDSFLQYLADNLPGITIHPIRNDPAHPEYALAQINALNVQFLNSDFSVHISKQYVMLEATADDDRAALQIAAQVAHLLHQSGSIPKFHYSLDNATPPNTVVTPTNSWIAWNPDAVNFKTVETGGEYVRLKCLLVLQHHLSDL